MKELLPIVLGVAVWDSRWKGLTVTCRSDNAAVEAIVNSGRSKMNRAMRLTRCLSFLAKWGVSLPCRHGPGTQNGAADGDIFVPVMASVGLKHRTTKSYMAGIRHFHVEEGLGDPFLPILPRLHYVLHGVKRSEGEDGATGRECLPITSPLLRQIKAVWDSDLDIAMLWAACCLAFFSASLGPASLRCHVSLSLTHLPTCHVATWQWMFRDSPV